VATWSVDIYPLNSGTATATNIPIMGCSFNYVLNGPGAFEADLALRNSSITQAVLAPGQKEVRLMRNSTLVWAGYLWGARVEMRDRVAIRAEGYLSKLRRRFVMNDLIYNDVNQQTIAWNLIAHTQGLSNGDMLITQGAHTGSNVTRDADYCALNHPNVASEIGAFTEFIDGIDFEITPTATDSTNKVFKTYQPKKSTDLSGTVIFTETNVAALNYELSADGMITRLVTTGQGDCNPPEDDRSSAGIATYGLMQEFVSLDTSKLSEVRAFGRQTLANYETPQNLMTVEYAEGSGILGWGQYVPGDIVKVNANWGPAGGFGIINQNFRVLQQDIMLQPPSNVFYRATLDSVLP
jgi:hypothetical protein